MTGRTRLIALIFPLALLAAAAGAAPQPYRLDAARSTVGFTFLFQGQKRDGTIPVKSARMMIDPRNVAASEVEVTLAAHRARTGLIFLTRTMKGPEVLDTARHPEIRFRSTRITGDLRAAEMHGDLTVRGVTRPLTLRARLYRQRGTEAGDLDRLTVILTGAISRSAFGADGYPEDVDDRIGLRIVARIEK